MAKRHQGKQQPTYKSLKAQGKVMSQEGDEITLKKEVPGRGGGLQGVSGDKYVWGRDIGDNKTKKKPIPDAKKTAKRRGIKKKKDNKFEKLYGDWV